MVNGITANIPDESITILHQSNVISAWNLKSFSFTSHLPTRLVCPLVQCQIVRLE